MRRSFDVVFQGGGARGIGLNGAVACLEEAGCTLGRLVGTSAGAIAASLCAAGFRGRELAAMSRERRPDGLPAFAAYVMEPSAAAEPDVTSSGLYAAIVDAERQLHVPKGIADSVAGHLAKWAGVIPGVRTAFRFVENGGVHTGLGFTGWLGETLAEKGADLPDITLGGLHRRNGADLTIVATDTTAAEMLVLNHRTAPDVPLVAAVRMSMSIPLFFEEVVWKAGWGTYLGREVTGHVVVDGGVLSNFPLRFVLPDMAESVRAFMGPAPGGGALPLGLHIDPTLPVPGAPPSAQASQSPLFERLGHTRMAQRIAHLVETMLDGNDETVEDTHRAVICPLPAQGYWATEFHMEPARVEAILAAGHAAMAAYLRRLDAGAA